MKIQEVKSPGGITAWLVEEHSVPLIAHALRLRRRQRPGPRRQGGRRQFPVRHAGRGRRRPRPPRQFQERMEEIAMRMSFDDSRDAFYGSFETLTGEPRQGRRAAGAGAQQAALRCRCRRPRARASCWPASPTPPAIPTASPPSSGAPWPSPAIPTAGRPTARRASLQKITRDDLARLSGRAPSPGTTCASSWWATSMPRRWPACSTRCSAAAGQGQAQRRSAQTQPTSAEKLKVIEMAVPQSVARFGLPAMPRKDKDFIAAFVLNTDPRRRRHVVAAVGGGAREARPRLFRLHHRAALQAHLGVLRRRRHQERGDRPIAGRDPRRAQAHGRRRADREGARRTPRTI